MSETEIKGILGTKLGMTQIFDEDNRVIPVTVVEAGPCVVTQIRTVETDGYNAIQIAYGEIDPRKANKPAAGHFKKAGVTPRRHVAEIRMDDVSGYELGQDVTVEIFEGINFVDVTGTTKGKGYAGAMKRHGFAGQGAAHGNQAAHRRVGGIGACATPGRVFKGTRMAGRMGSDRVTTQNLKVQKIDADANLILIKGAIPGVRGGIVTVKTAVKGGAHA
ncbi:50S ribosomal protein L3 [Corynebacterium diphtheriae bv. mitis]|uniref:Large ribosomal subunit protein uL3 n=5 Tax=Corynebacterium TaxID=1716 RepID=RL3_CORDI|nr:MULTISPECIES: 50S ribosomal protein L3 [Corynebacterium]P60453.1 RecName: Full=Large ribosomal subunit protein uL3; AltName: Full=50S ribosomal protein L3 [Corynebacterium diphtheriae NCTC 13129]ERA59006.1 50S ribosomal protein L3 [Corynebacterium diphtheriae DSM 43988]OWN10748.1 50S ribosomal protein L3 [Corynebacterium belfantii]AEX41158.1 50S ribosomal protein L3 [Corynebacterium diphtheriae 31A]AEX43479.1 50S ribosomal protein L3 [Corynebacterium diphtheriae 241]AEX45697.1 50S ribosoma